MRRVVLALCAVLAAASHSALAQTRPSAWKPSEQEKADLSHVRGLHRVGDRMVFSRPLDFSDPLQHRHFMSQVKAAGLTPQRYPQLFRSIEETRQTHLAARRANRAVADDTSCPNDQVCPLNILTTFGAPTTNPLAFSVNALSTIPNNPAVAFNIIGLYDQNDAVFAGPTKVVQNGTGYDLANLVNGNAPGGTTAVQAQGVWYYQPQGGGGIPGSFYSAGAPGQNPTIVNTAPTNVKGNNQIKICVTRQDADCDYWYQSISGQFVVRFPLQGNVTYPNPIAVDANGHPANAVTSVTISQPSPGNGGGCVPIPINQTFLNYTTVSNNVVSWNIDPAQFGVATPCFPSNTTVIFDLMLTVYDTNQKPWIIAITSQQGQPQSNTLRIYPTLVVYGCVAEGTLVTMADDTKRPIETIGVGEKIRSNAERLPLTVDNYTKGYEKPPMVLITTANGRALMLTEGHPVVTTAGLKLARKLKVGDAVLTDEGEARLVKVERKKFEGNVWNLDVGRADDRVRLTDTNTTFYANGILVGDGQIQGRMDRAEYESAEQVLKRLDKKWHLDFRNNEADKRARRAAP